MVFDLAASLRRLKPEKQAGPLVRRHDRNLPLANAAVQAGPPLLLDTTVYIDVLQARAPPAVTRLLAIRQVNHSSVAISELANLFGRLDPAHPGTGHVLREIAATIADIPRHSLSTPSVQACAEAGIVSGLVARLKRVAATDRQPLLNDATLFLHAGETGSVLLSGNIVDMDLIDQLVPNGRLLVYRRLA